MVGDRKRSGVRKGGEEGQVAGESSSSEPVMKKSKSSSSSKSSEANKNNENNKTLVKIIIEHCNS